MAAEHYQAVFADTATTPASVLRVKIPGFDNGVGAFQVTWAPLGNALPAAGDHALVVESDDGTWWAVSWWSAAQGATDMATQAELNAAVGNESRKSGTVTVTWPGSSVTSNIMTVTHGFASAPKVWIGSQNQAGVGVNTAYVVDVSATTFHVQVFTAAFQPPNTASTPVAWEAWL